MVTIHDPSEFACQALNRDLWSDQGELEFDHAYISRSFSHLAVKECIKESFIFLQVNIFLVKYGFNNPSVRIRKSARKRTCNVLSL